MEDFNEGSLQNPIFTGVHNNPIYRGNYFKRGGGGGGLGQFASLRGGAWQKRGRWCFEVLRRGVNTLVQAIDDVAMATWGPF